MRRLLLAGLVGLAVAATVVVRYDPGPGRDSAVPGRPAASGALVGLGDVPLGGVSICRGSEGATSAQIAAEPLCRALPADQAVALAGALVAAPAPANTDTACPAYLGLTWTLTFRAGTAATPPLRWDRCADSTVTVGGRSHVLDAALLRQVADGYEVGNAFPHPPTVLCPAEVVVEDGPPTPVCSDRTATVTARVGQQLSVRAPAPGTVDPAMTLNLVVASTSLPGAEGLPPRDVLDREPGPAALDADGRPLPDIATVRRFRAAAPGQEQFVLGAEVCRVAGDPCRFSHVEPRLLVTVTP